MSRGWEKPDLFIGEQVDLPEEVFISMGNAKKRLLSCRYIGCTDTGMRFEVEFPKSFNCIDECRYEIFINFASVYCGDIKIYRKDRTQVIANRRLGYGKKYIK